MSLIPVDKFKTAIILRGPNKPFLKVLPLPKILRLPADPAASASRVRAMTWQTGLGLIARHVLTTIGGGLVTNGAIDSGQLETGIGAIFVLAGIVWSVVQKQRGGK